MAWTETFTCNVCQKRKGASDFWWLAWVEQVQPSEVESLKPRFHILPWSELMARNPEVAHLCGPGCTLKEAERWMSSTAESSKKNS